MNCTCFACNNKCIDPINVSYRQTLGVQTLLVYLICWWRYRHLTFIVLVKTILYTIIICRGPLVGDVSNLYIHISIDTINVCLHKNVKEFVHILEIIFKISNITGTYSAVNAYSPYITIKFNNRVWRNQGCGNIDDSDNTDEMQKNKNKPGRIKYKVTYLP